MLTFLDFLNFTLNVYLVILFIRVILSWFSFNWDNPLLNFIFEITEPVLIPFRKFATFGNIDFSPVLVMIILEIIRQVINNFL